MPIRPCFSLAVCLVMLGLACDRHEERVPRMAPAAPPQGHMPPQMPDQMPGQMPPHAMPEQAMPGTQMSGGMSRSERPVVVPPALKGRWKAVKVVLFDKGRKSEQAHIVPLGKVYALSGTGLELLAENPLPHFSMEGGVFTSKSEQMENPAVQMMVRRGKEELFKGWMFMKFPTTHAFEHPKYALKVVEFVPA